MGHSQKHQLISDHRGSWILSHQVAETSHCPESNLYNTFAIIYKQWKQPFDQFWFINAFQVVQKKKKISLHNTFFKFSPIFKVSRMGNRTKRGK